MAEKDIISKNIFKRIVLDLATYLFHLPLTSVELLDTETQRVEDRRADLVAKVSDNAEQTFILHIEIQNDNQSHMPVRMLRYLTDILLKYPGLPVRQYLVYIGKAPLTMKDGLTHPQLRYRYTLLDMHQIDCDTLLQQGSPDALVLAVLCDFQDCPPREVIHTILTRLLALFHADPPRLREYVSMLEILASNRDVEIDIRQELEMLTIEIEKLPSYQLGMEKGVQQGLEKGLEKGAYERAAAIARKLLAMNMDIAQISAITGLAQEDILKFQDGKLD